LEPGDVLISVAVRRPPAREAVDDGEAFATVLARCVELRLIGGGIGDLDPEHAALDLDVHDDYGVATARAVLHAVRDELVREELGRLERRRRDVARDERDSLACGRSRVLVCGKAFPKRGRLPAGRRPLLAFALQAVEDD